MTTATIFYRKGLTGGGSDDLDNIAVTTPADNDLAITAVESSDLVYVHRFDSSATDAESSPDYIRPDDYATAGVWVLQRSSFDVAAGVEVGMITWWTTETAPTGWMFCNGATINRTTYSDLFAIIGEIYGEGDGSTTFEIPDLAGKFVRGWADGSSSDPDRASRTDSGDLYATGDHIGTQQAHDTEAHSHDLALKSIDGSDNYPRKGSTTSGAATTSDWPTTGGNETRPINIYLMPIIKF